MPDNATLYGRIKLYNTKSKFGFITQLETNTEFYFKNPKEEQLLTEDVVSFQLKASKKGPSAINVAKVPERGD